MSNNDNLERVVLNGFAEIKELLSDVKKDVAKVKEETREAKGMAEKNAEDGKKRDERLAVLEAEFLKLKSSDQDTRRRNGRR